VVLLDGPALEALAGSPEGLVAAIEAAATTHALAWT